MTKKMFFAAAYVLAGMVWTYEYMASKTKTADLMLLSMGLVMMFHGLEKLLEERNAAVAKVFGRIAGAGFILGFVGLGLWLLDRF